MALFNPVQIFPGNESITSLRILIIYGKNKNVTGIDMGFINSTTKKQVGLQYGFISNAGSMKKVQIGLINFINKGGMFPFFPIVNWVFLNIYH